MTILKSEAGAEWEHKRENDCRDCQRTCGVEHCEASACSWHCSASSAMDKIILVLVYLLLSSSSFDAVGRGYSGKIPNNRCILVNNIPILE